MTWSLVQEFFDPEAEGLREALCALGNGYFVTRGAAAESAADDVHYPGTYLAGGYNRLQTDVAGHTIENEDLVNMPNWVSLSFRIDGGPWFNLREVEILSYRQELDIESALLLRDVHFRDLQGRAVRLRERRMVHIRNQHLAAVEIALTAEGWSGTVEFRSALDGDIVNAGVERYRELSDRHLEPVETSVPAEDTIMLKVQTNQSRLVVAQAARTRVAKNGSPMVVERHEESRPGYVAQHFEVAANPGETLTVRKVVSLYTSRDRGISECGLQAAEAVARAGTFDELLESHEACWDQLWLRFDTELEFVDPEKDHDTTWVVKLHIFHLLQTCSMHTEDLDVGVPARGWHGEAYRGHVFWDELFIFPLLNLRIPEITRALLMYRYRRLDAARTAAKLAGYRGAMYPWQSGSDGREESQSTHLNPQSGRWIPDNSRLQRHVNLAIAYNVWQYYQATEDMEFLAYRGAELVLEIARFWSSVASYNPKIDRYEIAGVMGPDEYHEAYPEATEPGLKNNTYTNVMVVWVLDCALKILDELSQHRRSELCELLELRHGELESWREITRKMHLVFHEDGVFSQFEGYEQLEELDWDDYREKYGDIARLDRILEAEGKSPNAYKLSKQPDVMMLFYVLSAEELERIVEELGYPLDPKAISRTIEYYSKRTSHGSTLSRIVHSWVLARQDRERSWKFFKSALRADVADKKTGTTREGIHLGAMAGSVDLMQRGYTGIEIRRDELCLDPCLPDALRSMKMRLRYRGHLLTLKLTQDELQITSHKRTSRPIVLRLPDGASLLRGDEVRTYRLGRSP